MKLLMKSRTFWRSRRKTPPVPPHEPATLEYFMRDYIAHLRHHLRQVLDVNDHRWLAG